MVQAKPNSQRRVGYSPNHLDSPLLEAVQRGLLPSAVVGLGIERLLMIICNSHDISEVRPFARLQNSL